MSQSKEIIKQLIIGSARLDQILNTVRHYGDRRGFGYTYDLTSSRNKRYYVRPQMIVKNSDRDEKNKGMTNKYVLKCYFCGEKVHVVSRYSYIFKRNKKCFIIQHENFVSSNKPKYEQTSKQV